MNGRSVDKVQAKTVAKLMRHVRRAPVTWFHKNLLVTQNACFYLISLMHALPTVFADTLCVNQMNLELLSDSEVRIGIQPVRFAHLLYSVVAKPYWIADRGAPR